MRVDRSYAVQGYTNAKVSCHPLNLSELLRSKDENTNISQSLALALPSCETYATSEVEDGKIKQGLLPKKESSDETRHTVHLFSATFYTLNID